MIRISLCLFTLLMLSANALAACADCSFQKAAVNLSANGKAIFSLESSQMTLEYDALTDNFRVLDDQEDSSCSFEIGVVTGAYFAEKADIAAIEGHSGNSRFLQLIDVQTCLELGEAIELGEEGAFVDQTLIVPPICDCASITNADCVCSSASVYTVSSACHFMKDEPTSRALTKERINVVFDGKANVAFPGEERAQLINKR